LDNVDEALEAYLKSISIDPIQPDTLMAIANIYMDDADFQTALKYYELAYSFDTNLEYIEMFLAVAYYYTSDYDNTAKFLELAVQRNLDAVQMFLELCPDANAKFLSDKKTD
jgi:tetratricopeptide (TPR) repeat protein